MVVPLMVKIMRALARVQAPVSVMSFLNLPTPMTHPMAAPASAVSLVLVETEKPVPSVSALLLVTSQ